MLIGRFSANTLPVRIDEVAATYALRRQQVDRADFVVVAEHAPCRAGRARPAPYWQFVIAWNLR